VSARDFLERSLQKLSRRGAEAKFSTPSLHAVGEGSQEERIFLFSSLLFSSLLSALLI
jgi:hypothetical protein